MATTKSALASAKAKMAKIVRGVKKGDAITFTNRLYAVVDAKGRLQFGPDGVPRIEPTRTAARGIAAGLGLSFRIARLNDITGLVQ